MKATEEVMAAGASDERSRNREASATSDATPASTLLENATVPQAATRSTTGNSSTQVPQVLQQSSVTLTAAPGYSYVAMKDEELELWVELRKQWRQGRTDP